MLPPILLKGTVPFNNVSSRMSRTYLLLRERQWIGNGGGNGDLTISFLAVILQPVWKSKRGALSNPSQGSLDECKPCVCRPRQARLVEPVPWDYLPLCNVVSRACVVGWILSQSDLQCWLPAIENMPHRPGSTLPEFENKEKLHLNFEVWVSVQREGGKVLHSVPLRDWDG